MVPLERYFLAKLFLLIHVPSIAPAQGWKSSALIARLSETQSQAHVWTCDNMDLWAIFIYFSFICCETVIMEKCDSGLDLSHPWNYDQPFSSGCRLIVSCALLVQHCPLPVVYCHVYLLRLQWSAGKKDVKALWYTGSTINICLQTLSKLIIDVSHLLNLPRLWTSLFTHIIQTLGNFNV